MVEEMSSFQEEQLELVTKLSNKKTITSNHTVDEYFYQITGAASKILTTNPENLSASKEQDSTLNLERRSFFKVNENGLKVFMPFLINFISFLFEHIEEHSGEEVGILTNRAIF